MKALLEKSIRYARNFYIDLKYGYRFLGGTIKTKYLNNGINDIANSDYKDLKFIFTELYHIKNNDVIVDIGCGKGRTINYWLNSGIKNKIIGIELDENIAKFTQSRLKKYKNVYIIHGDALDNLPSDGTVFYLYNPFSRDVLQKFNDCIIHNKNIQKDIIIIYNTCAYVDEYYRDNRFKVDNVLEITSNKIKRNIAIIRTEAKNNDKDKSMAVRICPDTDIIS